jgi:hypothetical protein
MLYHEKGDKMPIEMLERETKEILHEVLVDVFNEVINNSDIHGQVKKLSDRMTGTEKIVGEISKNVSSEISDIKPFIENRIKHHVNESLSRLERDQNNQYFVLSVLSAVTFQELDTVARFILIPAGCMDESRWDELAGSKKRWYGGFRVPAIKSEILTLFSNRA